MSPLENHGKIPALFTQGKLDEDFVDIYI